MCAPRLTAVLHCQIKRTNRQRFGEVLYFFQIYIGESIHTLAMLRGLSEPDEKLLETSYSQHVSCKILPNDYFVEDAKNIFTLIGAFPHRIRRIGGPDGELIRYGQVQPANCYYDDRLLISAKPGEAMSSLGTGFGDGDDDDDLYN